MKKATLLVNEQLKKLLTIESQVSTKYFKVVELDHFKYEAGYNSFTKFIESRSAK